jgi:hypothetical protein
LGYLLAQLGLVSRLALPNYLNAPTCRSQSGAYTFIARTISSKFLPPVFLMGLRRGGFAASLMPMPKASVNQDR